MSRYLGFARAQWDRVLGWVLVGVGGLLVVTGAINVSRAGDQLDQLSYLASGPAIGLFLLIVGAVLLMSADLRDEWSKLDEVAALLRRSAATEPPGDDHPPPQIDLRAARVGVTTMVAAGLGVAGGALGARQSLERASAARWTGLSGASLALVVLAAGFLWLQARRDVRLRLAAVDEALAAHRDGGGRGAPGPAGPSEPVGPGAGFVVDGSALYHRPGCDLLGFAEAAPVSAAGAAQAGLEPCPLCR